MAMQQDIARLVETLKRERDELNLQLHLFKAEAKTDWTALERKWTRFQRKAESVGTNAGHVAGDVGAAVRLLGKEVRGGYRKIRDSLKSA